MDDYVQVPVPKRFVARVYALLAQLTNVEDGIDDGDPNSSPALRRQVSAAPEWSRMDLRYQRLGDFLGRAEGSDVLSLTIDQLEGTCGGKLPASAYKHRAWWANTDSHSHAQSWQRAGFRVARVAFDREKRVTAVTFQRIGSLSGAS